MGQFQITGLKPNVQYRIQIKSVNSNGESQFSPAVSFNTPSAIIDTLNSNTTIRLGGGALYAGSLTTTGVVFDQNGISGFKSGASTFYISAATGDASFFGTITASAGQIGGFAIKSNSLSATNIIISSSTGLNYGPDKFIVDQNGNASALSLYASGTIIATSGSFTGTIYAQSGSFTGNINSTASIFGAALYGGLFQTSGTSSYVSIDGARNFIAVYGNSPSGIFITPLQTIGGVVGSIIHYGASANPTGTSNPQIYMNEGFMSMGTKNHKISFIESSSSMYLNSLKIETNPSNIFQHNGRSHTAAGTYEAATGYSLGSDYQSFNRDTSTLTNAIIYMNKYNSAGANLTGAQEFITFYRNNSNTTRGYITFDGTTAAVGGSSDRRLKDNIEDFNFASEIIKKTKLRSFRWKNENVYDVGFIADELSQAAKHLVIGEENAINENGEPEYQGIIITALIPYLTGALKDAIIKIEELEARIAALENK
ncbi:MAG: hypothetical protein EB127_03260 [Alphaproteobacteria bacterium]|nr:hypothetical protein [Alphaproteobacteria bacterium]